jgi:3-phenylpropionate/trans-cinnamate dioxygenase ferredoxin component
MWIPSREKQMTIRELHRLMPSAAVEEGERLGYALLGMSLLVCRIDGEVHVYENRCPLDGLGLDTGVFDGRVLRCPGHAGGWDLRSGQPLDDSGTVVLKRYDVFEQAGSIQLVTV